MQKSGQIYLLVAVVIAMVVFGLVSIMNKVYQEDLKSQFEQLSDNYASESSKLINSLIANPEVDIASAFVNFTLMFTSYAKTINPKFGLIYAFYYNDKLYLGNYLDTRISFGCERCSKMNTLTGCFETIPATVNFGGLDLSVDVYNTVLERQCDRVLEKDVDFTDTPGSVYITIGNVPYSFKVKEGHPEIIIVGWEKREEQRKVFTEGNFIEAAAIEPITLSQVCNGQSAQECDRSICRFEQNGCSIRCDAYTNQEECSMDQQYCQWDTERGECNNE